MTYVSTSNMFDMLNMPYQVVQIRRVNLTNRVMEQYFQLRKANVAIIQVPKGYHGQKKYK